MSDIRVDRVTIGSPTYKVVVGDYTRVLKIEVGAPTRNVLVSNQVELEDVIGVTITEPISEGQLLIADSTGEYVNTNILGANIEIDALPGMLDAAMPELPEVTGGAIPSGGGGLPKF